MLYNESHTEPLNASYKACIATGIVLLGFYYYFTFWTTGTTDYANNGTGIISVLVCLSPVASGAITLFTEHLTTQDQAIITFMLVIHLLSMISIVIHVVTKFPVPKKAIVLITRIWAFASIGLAILVVIIVIFPDFIRNRNRDSR